MSESSCAVAASPAASKTIIEPKLANNRILWIFAIGQLGWSTLSGVINNWLVNFYEPDTGTIVQHVFITQGPVILGFITIIGLVAMLGRVFDAFTDPWIANKSDNCKHRLGRRMPFLRYAPIPFGILTVAIFCMPIDGESMLNNIWLVVSVLGFYLAMTCYCTPYNALIPELGRTQKLRINVSTFISTTYFFGTAIAYLLPNIAGIFEPTLGEVLSVRVTIGIIATFAVVCMLVPSFAIKESEYAEVTPSNSGTVASLLKTFGNKQFRTFVFSDVLYWISLTMFQTGLSYYITVLMGLDAGMTFPLFALMTLVSFLCYLPVNIVSKRVGKKRMIVFAFLFFAVAFGITSLVGTLGLPGAVWGVIVGVLAAVPMAILGILPQAVVADVAQADAVQTGEARQGMFYAARTFAMKLGQSVSLLMFTSIAALELAGGMNYRLTAIVACVFCVIAGLVFMRYRESEVFAVIGAGADAAGAAPDGSGAGATKPE